MQANKYTGAVDNTYHCPYCNCDVLLESSHPYWIPLKKIREFEDIAKFNDCFTFPYSEIIDSNVPFWIARCIACKQYIIFKREEKISRQIYSDVTGESACEDMSEDMRKDSEKIYGGTLVPKREETFQQIYPEVIVGEPASEDMPEDMKKDFEEARQIAAKSPRAAIALLRLVLQKLGTQLTGKDKIKDSVDAMIQQGFSPTQCKMFDTARIIGNNSVHPGSLNVDEDPELVTITFKFINLLVERLITLPKNVETLYSKCPEKQRRI